MKEEVEVNKQKNFELIQSKFEKLLRKLQDEGLVKIWPDQYGHLNWGVVISREDILRLRAFETYAKLDFQRKNLREFSDDEIGYMALAVDYLVKETPAQRIPESLRGFKKNSN